MVCAMANESLTILYICPDPSLGGSTRSLINMIESIRDYVFPIVLLTEKREAYFEMKKRGYECIVCPYVLLHNFYPVSWTRVIFHPWRLRFIKYHRIDWKCVKYLERLLKGRKVDIVHSNFSPVTIGIQLSKRLHAKHVWHIREFLDLDFHYDIYLGIPRLRRLINNADASVIVSSAISNHWNLKNKNTWIIPNPITTQDDCCYSKRKEPYLLFCSYYLTEAKGTRLAIVAFAKSGMATQGFRLKLMGNCTAEYKQTLTTTMKEAGVENAIDFIPCQTDVKPWFAHATAYIMASECEGLGRVTAEAMFYGCPVIARATGGTLDLVKDGVTGYLFNTIEECAQLIQKVCTENQEKVILQAQKFAVDNLSQEMYGPKVMEVYYSVMR